MGKLSKASRREFTAQGGSGEHAAGASPCEGIAPQFALDSTCYFLWQRDTGFFKLSDLRFTCVFEATKSCRCGAWPST